MKIFLFVAIIYSAVSWGNSCVPSHDNCSAYLCMEEKYSCGYKGYLLKNGYRFCQSFLNIKTHSPTLSNWLENTRYCLQEKLINNPNYNCKNISNGSINDHVSCYEETGYCQFNRQEKLVVKKQILKDFARAPLYITKNIATFFKKACKN
jgi:hypothetical protein